MVGRKSGHQLGRDALEWLATVPADRPYFAFLNFFDAHAPYLPAAPFDTLFSGRRRSWAERNPQLYFSEESTPQADVEREAYDQALASQDHDLGTFLAQCRARGLLRNTIIVITADHGEEFGEWGLLDHGLSLHPAALRVPLVVILAGRVPEGIRIAAPVSLLNLAATILALADSGASRELPGTPLPMENIEHNGVDVPVVSELEKGVPQQPEWFPVSDGPLRAVTTRRWHYIRDARGRETLMDLSVDPAGRLADPSDSLSFQARAALRAVLGALGPLRTAP
jgi:arylsulfatase A-like enzyme